MSDDSVDDLAPGLRSGGIPGDKPRPSPTERALIRFRGKMPEVAPLPIPTVGRVSIEGDVFTPDINTGTDFVGITTGLTGPRDEEVVLGWTVWAG